MDTDTTDAVMTTEQRVRAEALRLARDNTTGKSLFGGAAVPDTLALIEAATWIIDGRDPLTDYRQPAADAAAAPTFVGTIRDAAETTARDFADFLGIDPDAPLPDSDGDAHDDDTQFGSVTA